MEDGEVRVWEVGWEMGLGGGWEADWGRGEVRCEVRGVGRVAVGADWVEDAVVMVTAAAVGVRVVEKDVVEVRVRVVGWLSTTDGRLAY